MGKPRRYCEECGRPALVFRKVKHSNRHRGKVKVFTDRHHTLCSKCSRAVYQKEHQP